jgi:putative tryptophan/tyrosine transport system substrate-binding protein
MKRRSFNTLFGGTAVSPAIWPALLHAQQKAMPVIGWLSAGASRSATAAIAKEFREGLGDTGFAEGQNVTFANRWAEGRFDQLPALAADLVRLRVNVIVAIADPAVHAAKEASQTIPIVFLAGDDPVAAGLSASLGRPGSNLTGVTILTGQLNPKRIELLKELVPKAIVIALLVNPNNPATGRVIEEMQEATRRQGARLLVLKATSASEIDIAFASLVQQQIGALVVDADVFFTARRQQLVTLAMQHAVPAVYGFRQFCEDGGLISYSTNIAANVRQLGVYTGKILNGTRPTDLPVQQPTKFELVVNLRTAKALGVTIPPSILARADEVIE